MLMPTVDPDYYALLRVDPSADAVTIRTAWAVEQRLWGVRQNAPDLATRHEAERHVQLLGEVKDVLLDPHRRANYDRERARSVASRAAALTVPVEATPRAVTPRAPGEATPPGVTPRGTLVGTAQDKIARERGPGLPVSTTRAKLKAGRARGDRARLINWHGDILKPLVIGLAGALITGTQVFHWDLSSLMAVVSWLWALTDTLHG